MAADHFVGPNFIVPTPPVGDSTHRMASSQFVTLAVAAAVAALPFAVSSTQVEFISGVIQTATNQDYRIVEALPYAVTLNSFVGILASGTMTAALKINATAVTGGSMGVSAVQSTVLPSALNTAALGSAVVLTISSSTSPVNFSYVVKYTRQLT